MSDTNDYIQIMLESLEKKSELLDKLIARNEAQRACVEGKDFDTIDWETFNILVVEKDIAIERINKMDEGFQSLYDRVKEQLNGDKDKYAAQIKEIQRLIGVVTDQGVRIRTEEERNRKLIETVLGGKKKEIRQTRNSLRVVSSYAKTMQDAFGAQSSTISLKSEK